MRRTKFKDTVVEIRRNFRGSKSIFDTDPYYIGSYAKVTRKQYKKIRKRLSIGRFHMTEGSDYFVIKIIDKKIQKVVRKICK